MSEILQNTSEIVPTEEEISETSVIANEDAPILLIVDDNQDIRNYVSSIFESSFTIHTAGNGKEGWQLAEELVPDVVVSDVMMPKEDGFSLAQRIKESELTAHIPVLLLTAKTEDESKLKGAEAGADAYLTKPFSSKLLKATVKNLLDTRRKLQQRFAQEVILKPKDISVSSTDEQFLNRLQKVMDKEMTKPDFSSEGFSKAVGVSRMQLHRKLKALTGQTTSEFIRSQRIKAAAQLIKTEKISFAEVGYTVGFNDPSYFARCFKQEMGVSPSEYANSI